jgi:hypothetical protein
MKYDILIPDYMKAAKEAAVDKLEAHIETYDSRKLQDLIKGGWADKMRYQVQAGLTARLVAELSAECGRHVIVYAQRPFIFTGQFYAPLSEKDIERFHFGVVDAGGFSQQEWHAQDYRNQFTGKVMQYAHPRHYFGFSLPKAGWLFQDGFLDIHGKLHTKVKPEWLCMWQAQRKWKGAKANPKKFLETLNHAIDQQEVRDYVLASFGNALAGDPLNAQRALLLVGIGGSGKSTILDAVSNVVGRHNRYDIDSIGQLTEKGGLYAGPTEYATLCVAADSSANVKQSDTLKKFISKEPVTAKELYQQPRTIVPRSSIVAGSHDAQVERLLNDSGIFRRFDIVGFYNPVTKKDSQLHVKLEKETADIAWLLAYEALKHAKANGHKLERPAALREYLESAAEQGDVIAASLSQMGLRIAKPGDEGVWLWAKDIRDNVMEIAKEDGYEVKWQQVRAKLKTAGPNSMELDQPFNKGNRPYYRFSVTDAETFKSYGIKPKKF